MTLHYDVEMLRIALDRVVSAADEMLAHEQSDWLCHRLEHIMGECQSLREAMEAYEIETKGGEI